MAKRRKDDRTQPEDAWFPAQQLPPEKPFQGRSAQMIVCRKTIPGHFQITIAEYCFDRRQWRTVTGEVENVTHWQRLPTAPKEYRL